MSIYPKSYFEKVTDISPEFLKENKIQGLILDVDNTLIDFDRNLLKGIDDWYKKMRENNIKCMILSNSNKQDKIKMVADSIGIPYIFFSTKPLKRGFIKAQKELELPNENIAVVGDQIFTDVIGANRCKMFSILVKPIAEKDIWITLLKRPIENAIKNRYKKTKEGAHSQNAMHK